MMTSEELSVDMDDGNVDLDGNIAAGADTIDAGVSIDEKVDGEVDVDFDVDVG